MKLPEPLSNAADKAKDLYTETTGKAVDMYDQATDKGKELLDSVPDTLKAAGDKTAGAFKSLTTTQKVVGGALLAAGLALLLAPKKKGKAKRAAKALDQLLLFVNDRIEGYKRAVSYTKDAELKSYYQKLVGQSQRFSNDLNLYLTKKGGEREVDTTLKGKLYRRFMDATAAVTGHDEKAILAANIHGEQWALKAYKKALRRKALKGDIREAVEQQLAESKKTFAKLKQLATEQK